jgi:hypothetical protein
MNLSVIPLPLTVISSLAPETMAIPDVRDPYLLQLLSFIYEDHALLLEQPPSRSWISVLQREIDIDQGSDFFDRRVMGTPLREGKHIHQFTADFTEPTYRLRPEGDEELVRREWKRSGNRGLVPKDVTRFRGEHRLLHDGRRGGLEVPVDQYRLGFRNVARATDERTLIAAVIPPGTALGEAVPFFHRSIRDDPTTGYRTLMDAASMLYLCGVLNSLVLDFVARRKVTAHLTKSIMATLPIPDPLPGSERQAAIVGLAGRLTCQSPAFDDLADVLDVPCVPLDHSEVVRLRVELDAHVAHLYKLSKDQLIRVLTDFRRSRGEGTPVPPDDAYKAAVLDAFERLRG